MDAAASAAAAAGRPADVVTSSARRAAYERAGHWNGDTLAARVAEHARTVPHADAVVDLVGARTVSYAQLDADANRLANFLIGAGVKPGDVVSVQMPNWYETVVIDLGVMRAGAVMNPLLPNYRGKELRHMLGVGGVRVYFCPVAYRNFDHAGLAAELRAEMADLEHVVAVADPAEETDRFYQWLRQNSADPPTLEVPAAAVSELIFTSGTEAEPKAIMHTEQNTNFSARAVASSLGLGSGDVVWMPSPIGHSTGFNYGVRPALYLGLPLVLQDQWSPADAARLVESQRCSYTIAATTFVSDICEHAAANAVDLSSMRLFGSGGSPIPPEIVNAAAVLGMNVLRLYGSTELLMATTNRPGDPEEKLMETDGRALDDVEVAVRDEAGRELVGEPGEIFVRGPNTCVGFFNDPQRTSATFLADGWVRSGDLGILDEEGFLTIVGRKKEIIIRGGLNIAPREIEELILLHPAVAEAAVVGLPHPRLGEATCAAVVLREGQSLDLADLVAFLRQQGMATYKLPQRLELLAALPRTLTGKVQKFEIVKGLEGETRNGGA
ncbi:MAG: AMP-binding protein [Solirubrobacterales bacterium]